jgi:hypothetical protein
MACKDSDELELRLPCTSLPFCSDMLSISSLDLICSMIAGTSDVLLVFELSVQFHQIGMAQLQLLMFTL